MLPDYLIKDGEHVLDYARRIQERAKLTISDGEFYINKANNYIESLIDCVNDLVNVLERQKELAGGEFLIGAYVFTDEEERMLRKELERFAEYISKWMGKGKKFKLLIKEIEDESDKREVDGV